MPILSPQPLAPHSISTLHLCEFYYPRDLTQVEPSRIRPFVSGLFHEHNVLKFQPCCSLCQDFLLKTIFLLRLLLFLNILFYRSPHCVYPFICGWTLGLLLPFGYCEQGSCEHGCAIISSSPCFQSFCFYTQR